MENKKRSKFSLPAWSASLAIHATGAILILVAGFHIATPEGIVTDKTEFEAVDTNAAPAAAVAPVALAAPVAPQPEARQEAKQAPPVDEAPSDEEAPPAPTQEVAPQAANDNSDNSSSDPAQEPTDSPVDTPAIEPTASAAPETEATPSTETPTETPSQAEAPPESSPTAPVAAPISAPSATATDNQVGEGGVPKYGTPGTTIDESKLMEAFGNHKPDYPWTARLRRQQGTVILRAFIKKDGSVDQVIVDKSSGFPLIDEEAQQTYARWRYQPGLTGWVLKPFKFSLK